MARWSSVVCSLALATLLSPTPACERGAKTSTAADAGAAQVTSLLTPEQAQRVLARVGEKQVTLGDFAAALEHMDEFDRMRYQSPERRKELLEEMINVELLAQEAVARGWDKDPLAQQEIRAALRDAMLAESRKGLPQPSEVPEAEVRAYFEAHKAEFREPERRRISLIVAGKEAQASEALDLARKARTPAEWGDLVRTRSIDASARANVPVDLAGDAGFVSPPASGPNDNLRVPDAVREAAFEIPQPNTVLDRVVKVKDRFYVIRLTSRIEPHEAAYGEAERRIRVRLVQDRARAREREVLDKLKTQHKVEIDEAALAHVKVPIADAGAK